MSVEVRIDQLGLHGFPAAQRLRIAAAVERELARTLAAPGAETYTQSRARGRVDGGEFPLRPGARPGDVGGQIARAVYGGTKP